MRPPKTTQRTFASTTAAGDLARRLPAAGRAVHCSLTRDDEVVAAPDRSRRGRGRSAAPGNSSPPREASAAPRPPAAPAPGRSAKGRSSARAREPALELGRLLGRRALLRCEHASRIEEGHVDVTDDARRRRELAGGRREDLRRRRRSPCRRGRRGADAAVRRRRSAPRARDWTPSSGRGARGRAESPRPPRPPSRRPEARASVRAPAAECVRDLRLSPLAAECRVQRLQRSLPAVGDRKLRPRRPRCSAPRREPTRRTRRRGRL